MWQCSGFAGPSRALAPWRAGARFFLMLLVCGLLAGMRMAQAAEFDERQELDFGVIAIRSNDAVSTLTLRHRGQPVSNGGGAGGLMVVAHGTPGRYRLHGLPPLTVLDVSVTATDFPSLDGQGVGERLTLDTFTFDALTTSATGEAELLLGATLRTSGNGSPPPEGVYRGAFEIELRYWSVPDQAYVQREFGAFVRFELRSSIIAEELAPLRFGLLTAFADPARQATLRLSPAGAIAMSHAVPARVEAIAGATPGRIRVSGAAPGQLLKVVFEPDEIHLTPQNGSAGSARFVVGDFTTAPSGLAFKSDTNGTLEFAVGATLKTELSSLPYAEGGYHGVVTVVVNY
jgi:hypothetical protein